MCSYRLALRFLNLKTALTALNEMLCDLTKTRENHG
jgi:hypothetical protein